MTIGELLLGTLCEKAIFDQHIICMKRIKLILVKMSIKMGQKNGLNGHIIKAFTIFHLNISISNIEISSSIII